MFIDMPQIPFEVVHSEYKKTVHVVSSCNTDRTDSNTIYFDPNTAEISHIVFAAVNKAFDSPGIVRIQICRKKDK